MILLRLWLLLQLHLPTAVSLNHQDCPYGELDSYKEQWHREASKRFKNPVVVLVHGTDVNGQWVCAPDGFPLLRADLIAFVAKVVYAGRDVVLCSCNRAGLDLHIKGVWFQRRILWCEPGGAYRWTRYKDFWPIVEKGTGSIYEFECRR